MTWRLVRQVLLVMTVAILGALAVAPAVASDGVGAVSGAVYRLALVPEAGDAAGGDSTFSATVERSADGGETWTPAAGEPVSFAYVTDGAGLVTAVNGGPVGSMTCATDTAGQCSITVRSEVPGDSVVTASSGSLNASVAVR
ncbi:MAG: hypothetical protein ACRD0O_19755 [Acidimicrobiia bacterium]